MSDFVIRPLTVRDAGQAYALLRDSFSMPGEYQDMLDNLSNPITRALGLFDGETMIGYGAFWLLMEEAHVTHVAIHKNMRRQGLGNKMMAALIQHASDCGARFMELECRRGNEAALSMYHKLGFLRVGFKKNYYPDTNEDAVVLALISLPAPNEENDPFLTQE